MDRAGGSSMIGIRTVPWWGVEPGTRAFALTGTVKVTGRRPGRWEPRRSNIRRRTTANDSERQRKTGYDREYMSQVLIGYEGLEVANKNTHQTRATGMMW